MLLGSRIFIMCSVHYNDNIVMLLPLTNRKVFVIDMELMQQANLFDKLCEHGRGFKEYQVKHIAIQLVQAVAMLEANAISHRDIKLSNITFPVKINEDLQTSGSHVRSKHRPMQIKLADFGMAGFVEKDGFLRGRCGTPGYVAPGMIHVDTIVRAILYFGNVSLQIGVLIMFVYVICLFLSLISCICRNISKWCT